VSGKKRRKPMMWHDFVESRNSVHVELYPYKTLCGFEFDGEGDAVPGQYDVFELWKQETPFAKTDKRVVTCPFCVEIVRLCKTIEVQDLPPKPDIDEDQILSEEEERLARERRGE
jgi:hypothetical protein